MKIGTKKIVEYQWSQKECSVCGEPATNRITYLYKNARNNPKSRGYGGDDISWCSDEESYACENHRKEVERNCPSGMDWCATFYTMRNGQLIEPNMHYVCYWRKLSEEIQKL